MTAPPIVLRQAPAAALDALLRRALEAARAPMGWISTLEADGERLHARVDVPFSQLPPERSLAMARALESPLFLEDARAEGLASARMLAIVPWRTRGGVRGTLTVADPVARELGPSARTALANLAALAAARWEAQHDGESAAAAAPEGEALGERLEAEMRRRRQAEHALAHERAVAIALLEHLGGANFLLDAEGRLVRWNSLFEAALGMSGERIATMGALDFVSEADQAHVAAALREVLATGREVGIEAEVRDAQGNVRPYVLAARAAEIAGVRHVLGTARDITLRRRNEQHMARAKERLDLALAGSSLALWDWDFATDRVYFNENWAALRGEAPRESTFSALEVLQWPREEDRELLRAAVANARKGVSEDIDVESRIARADGDWMWIYWRGRVTQRDAAGAAVRMTGTCTNISKRKAAEERAEWLATRDALTGLPNRVLLHDRLEQAVSNAARQRAGFAFMFIDLDRFKNINDSLGHHAGDQLLKGVAARLTGCVRASDTVARLGGDEFAVILENLGAHDGGARAVADKMIAAMAMPLVIEGQPLATSCSIGISVFPDDGRDGAALMKNADVAMYHAKEKGRNNYQFFSADMNARAQERLSVESYLRLALKRNELVLHYQPRLEVASGRLTGVEALIRWQHPRRGLLAPGKFIDVAEDSGLIVAIGEWVLETACAQLKAWQRVRPGLRLSVNLSVGQVGDGDRLHAAVKRSLEQADLVPGLLELELTESHLMQNIAEKAGLLRRLGQLGVGLAIDDFGTGYSSLAYLKSLPVDAIKIDGSFVRDLHSDPDDAAIVRAIVAMAHALRLTVVAEGVETGAQLDSLRNLGCDEFQGYLESPALPKEEFEGKYLQA